jgi:hypothetical protein
MSRIFRIAALNFQGKNLESVRRSDKTPVGQDKQDGREKLARLALTDAPIFKRKQISRVACQALPLFLDRLPRPLSRQGSLLKGMD